MIHKKERQLIEWEKIFASDILNWKVKVNSIMSNSLGPSGLYSPWNSPGQNIRVGSLLFLQGIFPTQGLNPGFLHCRQILYQMSHKRSPRILEWVVSPFSRDLTIPVIKLLSPALQADSLPTELSGKPYNWLEINNQNMRKVHTTQYEEKQNWANNLKRDFFSPK